MELFNFKSIRFTTGAELSIKFIIPQNQLEEDFEFKAPAKKVLKQDTCHVHPKHPLK